MSNIVASYGGSIKAEHGTGRMVAPFVEVEWGKQAYLINKKSKVSLIRIVYLIPM